MKRALLSIAALSLLTTTGFAQITITQDSFGTIAGTTDVVMKAQNNSYTQVPGNPDHINLPHATGYTWNLNTVYSPLDTMPSALINYRHVAQTGYTYADSMTESLSFNNANFTYETNLLNNITPTGVIRPAQKVMRKAYSLSGLPGGVSTDSLIILEQTSTYLNPGFSMTPAPRTVLKLPLTSTTPAWNNNFYYSVKAAFTYAVAGYTDDTIERKRYIIDQTTMIGHGDLRVRKHNNGGQWSDYFNVLQMRSNFYQVTDSFYIGGVLATNVQLQPFGITQGATSTVYKDYFLRSGEITPLVAIQYTDASRNNVENAPAGRSQVHAQSLTPSSVNGVTLNTNFAIFPNPVKAGATLVVDLKDNMANGNWSYNIINVTGQQVATGSLNLNAGRANITLPIVPRGIYYIQATNGDQKIVKALDIE